MERTTSTAAQLVEALVAAVELSDKAYEEAKATYEASYRYDDAQLVRQAAELCTAVTAAAERAIDALTAEAAR